MPEHSLGAKKERREREARPGAGGAAQAIPLPVQGVGPCSLKPPTLQQVLNAPRPSCGPFGRPAGHGRANNIATKNDFGNRNLQKFHSFEQN